MTWETFSEALAHDDAFLLLTEGERPDCRNREFKTSRKILEYEKRGDRDSARMLHASLLKYCGATEITVRYALLDGLRDTTQEHVDFPVAFTLDHMLDYRERRRAILQGYPSYNWVGRTFGYWGDPNFDALTQRMATGLDTFGPNRDPSLNVIRAAYKDDGSEFVDQIRSKDPNSPYAREALDRLRMAHSGLRLNGMLFLGGWVPTGNLKAVNEHLYVGFKGGAGKGRFDLNMRVAILFPNGPYAYQVLYRDTLVDADVFAGPSFAIEPSFDVFQSLNWKVGIVGSVGSNWSVTYSEDPKRGTPPDLSSPDLGLGLRVSRLWGTGGLTHFEIQYHFLDFKNKGGSDLDGNAITAQVGIGVEGSYTWMRARRIWK